MIVLALPPARVDPHGSLRMSTGVYRAAFEAIGYRTLTVELGTLAAADVEAMRAPRVRAVFSDGGWINAVHVETATGRRPLVDVLDKPVVALINDSPCNHWMPQVIAQDRPGQTTAFLDADFATLWSRWVPKQGVHQLYVPACPVPPANLPDQASPDDECPIDVLAVVSLRPPDPFREVVRGHCDDPLILRLFDGILEIGLYDGLQPFSAVCDAVSRSLDMRIDYGSRGFRLLLVAADHFIRNRRRQIMLERLAAHPITLVGGGKGVRLHPDTRVLPAMAHADLLALYRRARHVVVSPPYAGGVTERTIQPMAAGALVVSPPTGLSDRLFGRDRLFVTVRTDFADLDEGLDRARDPALHRRMVADTLGYLPRVFSPAATVQRFLMGAAVSPLVAFPGTISPAAAGAP